VSVSQQPLGGTPPAGSPKPPNRVNATWKGGERFDTSRPNGPVARIDGTGETGQGPVDMVLSALASCVSIDVVMILAKRRTPVSQLDVAVTGTRAETTPRRLLAVDLAFTIAGDGIDRAQAVRAIDLGLNKYCSVHDSLASDIAYSWSLALNGEAGAPGQ
jgi:putative redox protein